MVKRIALDTNVAIAILNNQTSIISFLSQFEVIYLPITVVGELLFGAKNSGLAARNLKKYQAFITEAEILDIDYAVAERYAQIRHELKKNGSPIPENDIWIAACCLEAKIPLSTYDRHFSNVVGLEILTG